MNENAPVTPDLSFFSFYVVGRFCWYTEIFIQLRIKSKSNRNRKVFTVFRTSNCRCFQFDLHVYLFVAIVLFTLMFTIRSTHTHLNYMPQFHWRFHNFTVEVATFFHDNIYSISSNALPILSTSWFENWLAFRTLFKLHSLRMQDGHLNLSCLLVVVVLHCVDVRCCCCCCYCWKSEWNSLLRRSPTVTVPHFHVSSKSSQLVVVYFHIQSK